MRLGKATSKERVTVSMEELMAMFTYDCFHTYYSFRGGVNRRRFGVPMGGFMSPHAAVITCSDREMEVMEEKPDDLIGGCDRYMDDVVGVMAVSTEEEEARARRWFDRVKKCYPAPLVLNVEPESETTRFLEMVVVTRGPHITCNLHSNYMEAVKSRSLFIPRLPQPGGGTRRQDVDGIVIGFLHRALHGSSDIRGFITAITSFMSELVWSGWSMEKVKAAGLTVILRIQERDHPLERPIERDMIRSLAHLVGPEGTKQYIRRVL